MYETFFGMEHTPFVRDILSFGKLFGGVFVSLFGGKFRF